MSICVRKLLAVLTALVLALSGLTATAEAIRIGEESPGILSSPVDEAVPEAEEYSLPSGDSVESLQVEAPQDAAGESAPPSGDTADADDPEEDPDAGMMIEPVPFGMEQSSLTLGVKEKYRLTLENGIDPGTVEAVFTSSKPKVASVDPVTGEITARKVGNATITMQAQDTVSTCEVKVLKAPSRLSLTATKLTLGVGEEYSLGVRLPKKTASAIRFTSNKTDVVRVDGDGHVYAVGTGTAKITAKTFNKKKAVCKVTVKRAPTAISLGGGLMSVWEGDSLELKADLGKGCAGSYSLSVSDGGVLAVDGKRITALAQGTAVVTATAYNGACDSVTVEVLRRPTYRALLVGECHFPGTGMSSLPGKKDVALMKKMLKSTRGAANGKWSVTAVTDRTSRQIRDDIRAAFAGAEEGDVSLFFISTHGDNDLSMEDDYPDYVGFLQVYPDDSWYNWYDRNALTLPQLASWLAEVPGQVIVFIDSCGSGAAIYNAKHASAVLSSPARFDESVVDAFREQDMGVLAPGPDHGAFVVQNKFYVLTSTAYRELGWSDSDRYSYFTKWLTDGIATSGRMPADSDGDRITTLNELFRYIKKRAGKKIIKYEGVKYRQHVQVYPADSGFQLFRRK